MTGADWPFAEPEGTEVIALRRVLRGEAPLRLVSHDEDDGSWQFLDGEHVVEDDATVVLLGEMLQFDPSLAALAGLPPGWYAYRLGREGPWKRAPGEPPSVL
jgi:hypothetical protein